MQGLRRPDSGVLRVLGYDPARDAERLRPMLGSQLQDSGLPDRLRVGEAIELFATDPLDPRDRAARTLRPRRPAPLARSPRCPAASGSGCSSCWPCSTGRAW